MDSAQQTQPAKAAKVKVGTAKDLDQIIAAKEEELKNLKEAQRKQKREQQEKEANLKAITKAAQTHGWDRFDAAAWKAVAPKITELLETAQTQ